MVRKVRLAVFASGTGTNFQALYDAILQRQLEAEIVRLIVDKSSAGALNLAKLFGVPATFIKYSTYDSKPAAEQAILDQLADDQVDGILLAGYMRILTPKLSICIQPCCPLFQVDTVSWMLLRQALTRLG